MKTLSELCTEAVVNSHNDLTLNITRKVRFGTCPCCIDITYIIPVYSTDMDYSL